MRDLRSFPDWLHHELLNWSRWCWLGAWPHPLPPSHCASVEREYIPVGNAEERVEAERKPIPPNERNALIVDGVWRELPEIPKLVLRAEYPQFHESGRADYGRVGAARWLHIRLHEYESALIVAGGRVWDAFEGGQ